MENKLDFQDILASTLHDTKNSLSILFNSLDEITEECKERRCETHSRFYILQYEIKRLNSSLIRLLSLYKADRSQFAVNLDYYSVSEFLEEVALQHQPLLFSKGITFEIICPEDLFWVFDRNLVNGVLDNILNNAFKYTKDRIRITARGENEGELVLDVEDNGEGYPASMLFEAENGAGKKTVDFNTGSTGLGLYFSLLVAQSHTRGDRKGRITVRNGGDLGGGVFSIYLP